MFLVLISHLRYRGITIVSWLVLQQQFVLLLSPFLLYRCYFYWLVHFLRQQCCIRWLPYHQRPNFQVFHLGLFGTRIIVISENIQLQIIRWIFPGRLTTEPLIIINLFYSHFKAKTSKHLNSQYFSCLKNQEKKLILI